MINNFTAMKRKKICKRNIKYINFLYNRVLMHYLFFCKQISFNFCKLLFFQVDSIKAVLKKELEIPLVEIADKNARLDGGDVLFTGNDFMLLKLIYF